MPRSKESKTILMPKLDGQDYPSVAVWPTVGVGGLRKALRNTGYPPDRIRETESIADAIVASLTNLLVNGGGVTSRSGEIFAGSLENLGLHRNGQIALLRETVIEGQIAKLQERFGLHPDLFGLNPLRHAYLIAPDACAKIVRVDTPGGSAGLYILNADGSSWTDLHRSLILPFQESAKAAFADSGVSPLIAPGSLVTAFFYDVSAPAELRE